MRKCVGGYAAAAKHFNAEDLNVKCEGKSYMITGAPPELKTFLVLNIFFLDILYI